MKSSLFTITGLLTLFYSLVFPTGPLQAQCPTLGQNATLTSPDCVVGSTPCDLCPGDQFTLTPTGSGLPSGGCIDWYYGTTSNFNPYNGEGTLLGCSQITVNPPDPCATCPLILGVFIDACGTEQNNEWMALWSGSGFFVNDLTVDYDASNNGFDPANEDIGAGCTFQTPTAFAVNSIQNDCPGVQVVGVGPGGAVPPGVPVILFTSSLLDNNYDFTNLCGTSPVVYVLQSSCPRTIGAFSNVGSGTRTTTISLPCGCSQTNTYDRNLLQGGNGAFVTDGGVPVTYGNQGCVYPGNFPVGPPGQSPVTITPLTVTVTPDMCNNGPYWVTGIVDPLNGGCSQVFTNYLQFNVPCPSPTLGTASICQNGGTLNLVTLQDPNVPNGAWSGPGVSGATFNPAGQSGAVTLTFTPSGPCGTPATTEVTVFLPPTATFAPLGPLCAGSSADLTVNLTGEAPWTFNLLANGAPIGSFTTSDNPFVLPVTVNGNTTYALQNLSDNNNCNGANATLNVTTTTPPSAVLSLLSNPVICAGQSSTISVNFSNGAAPYTFEYAIDGVPQAPVTTSSDPYNFTITLTQSGQIELLSLVDANNCDGTVSGVANVTVNPIPTATLVSGSSTICNGQSVTLEIDFTGDDPYTFVLAVNGVNQAPLTVSGNNYTFDVSPTSGVNTYTLVSVTSNGCTGTVSGTYTVTVGAPPTAALSGGATICAGLSAGLTVDFNGTGPFTFEYTANGVLQTPVTTSQDPFTLNVTPTVTTTYALSSVTANGCIGTVSGTAAVTVNPSPTAALVSGDSTICAGDTVLLTVNLGGPSPYTLVYAINGVSQPPVTTATSPYLITASPAADTSIYTLVSVTSNGCTGTISGQYSVIVTTPPTASISGDTTVCSGSAVTLPIVFTGAGPFTFVYAVDGTPLPPITTTDNPYLLTVAPMDTTVYTLVSVTAGGCSGTVSGQATVTTGTGLTAVLGGGGQVCQGAGGTNLIVTFQGPGPYTFVYSANNVNQPPLTTTNDTLIIPVNPVIGTVYLPISVNNGSCAGTVSGQAVVFVFTPPTADLFGSQTFCDSANTNITVDFTGTGPFTIVLAQDGVQLPPINTFEDPFFYPVNTTTTTTLTLVTVESPGCVGIPNGQATITVNYPPTFGNVTLNCNPALNNYTVTFTVTSGTAPYTLVSGAGTFTGNTFTSAPIPQSLGYSFVFHDDINCSNVTVSGQSTCNCVTNAGALTSGADTACVTGTVSAQHNGMTVLDNNDTLRFILHTNPGAPVGQIFAWSDTPSFSFQPGMQTGVTYYISAIAGNKAPNGNVDLTDICLSVSAGVPVVFMPQPQVTLAVAPAGVCAGQPMTVTATLAGTPPFNFTPVLDGTPQAPVTSVAGPTFSWTINPDSTILVTVQQVSDQFCATGIATDTAIAAVYEIPQAVNVQSVCNFATGTYLLTFGIQGGIMPWTVSGVAGSFTGNQFTSAPIPFGTPYLITLEDSIACGVDTLSGVGACVCTTNAGQMSQTPLTFCGTSTSATAPLAIGTVLDSDDDLFYILHTNPGVPVGTILAWSTSPAFAFQGNMQTGVTYYISAIAGNPSGGLISLSDPCLSVANGTPVIWRPTPTATLSGAFDICSGQSQPLLVNLSGTPPYLLTYTTNGQPATTPVLQNTFTINATLLQSTTFQLTAVSDQFCPGTASGQAVVTVHQAPNITNVEINCSPDNLTYILEFDVLNVSTAPGAVGITGSAAGAFDAAGHFTSTPISVLDPYFIQITDLQWQCGFDTISGMSDCACATMAGTFSGGPLVLCDGAAVLTTPVSGSVLQTNDALVYLLVTTPNPATWTILASSNTPQFAYPAGQVLPGQTYYIVAAAANAAPGGGVDFADPCLSIAQGPTVTWRPPVSAVLSGDQTICAGDEAALTVIFTGDGPFSFSYTGGGAPVQVNNVANPYTLLVNVATATTYSLANVNGAGGCPGTASGSASVNIAPAPTALFGNDISVCPGDNAVIPVTFTGTAPFVFTYARNGVPQPPQTALQNTFNITINNVQQSQTLTLLSVEDAQCPGAATDAINITVTPNPTAALLGNITICNGQTANLTLQLNGANTFDLTISNGVQTFPLTGVSNGATVPVMPTSTSNYFISAATAAGNVCPVTIVGAGALVTVVNLQVAATLSNYNGFNISCPGETDGAISLTPQAGIPPYTATWSNNASGLQLVNLPEGQYAVTLTDAQGCSFTGSYTLAAPPALTISRAIKHPTCAGFKDGRIVLESVTGGSVPFSLFVNDTFIRTVNTFPTVLDDLGNGNYTIELEDVNGCVAEAVEILVEPAPILVNLGPDVTVSLGDTYDLEAIVNLPQWDTLIWTPIDLIDDPAALTNTVRPVNTTLFGLEVRDTAGCIGRDQVLIYVKDDKRVYLPNVIYPDGSLDVNGSFTVYGGAEVSSVPLMRIYDRWGECLFEARNLAPNDHLLGWKGDWKGKDVTPGVYVYLVEVAYFDGTTEIFSGDVTVVR